MYIRIYLHLVCPYVLCFKCILYKSMNLGHNMMTIVVLKKIERVNIQTSLSAMVMGSMFLAGIT